MKHIRLIAAGLLLVMSLNLSACKKQEQDCKIAPQAVAQCLYTIGAQSFNTTDFLDFAQKAGNDSLSKDEDSILAKGAYSLMEKNDIQGAFKDKMPSFLNSNIPVTDTMVKATYMLRGTPDSTDDTYIVMLASFEFKTEKDALEYYDRQKNHFELLNVDPNPPVNNVYSGVKGDVTYTATFDNYTSLTDEEREGYPLGYVAGVYRSGNILFFYFCSESDKFDEGHRFISDICSKLDVFCPI